MQWFYLLEKKLTIILERFITFLFFIILILTILLVILRKVFNSSIIGGNEAMEYLFIYTTAIGAAISIRKNDHIRINYFVNKLGNKLKKVLESLSYLLVAFINFIMLWHSFSWISNVGHHESPVLRIPNWIIQISVPIGCSIVVFFCFYNIVMLIIGKQDQFEA